MSDLVLRTRRRFPGSAAAVWSLLCSSRMDGTGGLLFQLGVPRPVECRLPDARGGVGSERECISDQGVVHQRISAWSPGVQLSFRMERTSLRFHQHVRGIEETFDLRSTEGGVLVTRTTRVSVTGRFRPIKKLVLYIGLKQIHRYVFRNWLRLVTSENMRPSALGGESRPTS